MFKDNFKLIYTSDNFYVFSQEFEKFPDKDFYKNIIFFTIQRKELEVNMGAIYIKSEKTYNKYKNLNFNKFKDENYRLGESITSYFNRTLGDVVNDESYAIYTDLAGCELKEVEKKKAKI